MTAGCLVIPAAATRSALIRIRSEFQQGQIARISGAIPPCCSMFVSPMNSLNVPLAELTGSISELTQRKQSIVVVCKTDQRSARTATDLLASGLTDVATLCRDAGGWHRSNQLLSRPMAEQG